MKGNDQNKMCYSLNQAKNRDAFKADEESFMSLFDLTEVQRQAIRDQKVLGLIEESGNIY